MTHFVRRDPTDDLFWHAYQLKWARFWRALNPRRHKLIQWRFVHFRQAREWRQLFEAQELEWSDSRYVLQKDVMDRINNALANIERLDVELKKR